MSTTYHLNTWFDFRRALIAPGYKETKALNARASEIISYVVERRKVLTLDRNILLFRARVGGEIQMPGMPPLHPYRDSEISAPPADKASSGRFNAEGVPFLYLSTSKEVALAETRPMPNEKCSVASFSVPQGLKVVNLIPEPPLQGAYGDFSDLERFWVDLCKDAAQQFSSNDVAQRYRSLQYVASIFLEEDLDGIVYRSAFFEDHWHKPEEPWGGGSFYNYVLFDPSKAIFSSSELKTLKRVLSI